MLYISYYIQIISYRIITEGENLGCDSLHYRDCLACLHGGGAGANQQKQQKNNNNNNNNKDNITTTKEKTNVHKIDLRGDVCLMFKK